MTYLADQFGGGIAPLQNFDVASIGVESRKGRFAGRIKGHDSAGRPIIEQDSVGDVRNAMMWEPASRAVAAWSHAMPVVGGSPVHSSGGRFSDPDLVAKEGGAGGVGGQGGGGVVGGKGTAPGGADWFWKDDGWFYFDPRSNAWRSAPITVKPPPFTLNGPGGGAFIGRQGGPGFGLNAPGGVYITYPRGGSGGQMRGGYAPLPGAVGAQGQGGAVGNFGPAGSVQNGARAITGSRGPSFQAMPIRGEYAPDGSIAPKSVTLPDGFPSLAGGSVGTVIGGTEHLYEAPVYLHGDPRLVSVNEGPDPTASSVVLDTDAQGRLDPGLSAPLHSAWRVIEPVFSRTSTGARGTLAWQMARGERDGIAGFGAVVDTSVRGAGPRSTPTTTGTQGGNGSTADPYKNAAYSPHNPGAYFNGARSYEPKGNVGVAPAVAGAKRDDTPALCVGLMSSRVGGPLEVGHGKADKHRIGTSGSRAANVGHLSTNALFFRDPERDAPLDFETDYFPAVPLWPMKSMVHLQYATYHGHSIPGRSGIKGRWKWWASVPYTSEGGELPPVTPPRDPPVKPPHDPKPPDDGPPVTPPDTNPKPPVRPTTPTDPITPGGGSREPTDPPPPVAGQGAGAAVGGRMKPRFVDYDGTFETSDDGAIGSIPSVSTYPTLVKPRSLGGATDKTIVHPGTEAFTSVTFKPQSTAKGTIDLRGSPMVGGDEANRQSRERPTTLRLEAYGGQTAGVFLRTQTRGASRFVGGTGPGGVVYMPPEQDILDIDRASFVPTSSTSYVGAVPGVYFATGYPLTSTGGWKTGYRWGGDSSGNLVFSAMDSSGAAATALTLDSTGGTTISKKFALAGVVSPAQITSNQNDYNPTGLSGAAILRIYTDAARSITGLAGGADDRMLVVTNVGAYTITLKNADTGSTAANRFLLSSDLDLAPEQSAWLTYDNTSARWRHVGPTRRSHTPVMMVPPGLFSPVTAGNTTMASDTPYAQYLGRAIRANPTFDIVCKVTTAYAAGTWAEVAIATGTPAANAAAALTTRGYTDVAATFNSTGIKKTTVTTAGIAEGDDVWVIWGSKGGTHYATNAALLDILGSGVALSASAATQPSTMGAGTSFSVESTALTPRTVAFQY